MMKRSIWPVDHQKYLKNKNNYILVVLGHASAQEEDEHGEDYIVDGEEEAPGETPWQACTIYT
jgi:hypothetical protein